MPRTSLRGISPLRYSTQLLSLALLDFTSDTLSIVVALFYLTVDLAQRLGFLPPLLAHNLIAISCYSLTYYAHLTFVSSRGFTWAVVYCLPIGLIASPYLSNISPKYPASKDSISGYILLSITSIANSYKS